MMNKKNIIYILVFLLLLGVAAWLLIDSGKKSTVERKLDYSFSIKDTASIDKIIIKDKRPSEVTLVRKGKDHWEVNDSYKARRDAIKTLLETLYRMELSNFLKERTKETVIKRMAVYGKEVQLFKNGEHFKTFYVGTDSPSEMSTYMMNKGADSPYAVYMPGFNGFLSTRFFTQPELWRSRDLTDMNPDDIKEVEMHYPDSAAASFKVTVYSQDSISVTSLRGNEPLLKVNQINAKFFVASFRNLKYEGSILTTDPIWTRRDSLLKSQPVFKTIVKSNDGRVTSISGYKIKGPEESFDPDLEPSKYDPDRMHGFINDERMILLQYKTLGNILKPIDYFK